MRFKEFLALEDQQLLPPWKLKPAKMSYEDMLEWVQNNAIRHVNNEDIRIYRGVSSAESAEGLYNGANLKRQAANTRNFYNLWLTNHSAWSDFPRRDKSFICSTHIPSASDYGDVYIVIPQDTTKIGICPRNDLWYSFKAVNGLLKSAGWADMDLFMMYTSVLCDMANIGGNPELDWDIFAACLNKVDLDVMNAYTSKITNKDLQYIHERFVDWFKDNRFESAYEAFERMFDPKANGFLIQTGASFNIADDDREVWMSGGILMLEQDTWKRMEKDLHL